MPSAQSVLDQTPLYRKQMLKILGQLSFDPYSDSVSDYHREGLQKFGPTWDFVDLPLLGLTAASILQSQDYLEVGVRRGRSLACVFSGSSKVRMTCVDLWVENYAGISNPGPEFVKSEIRRLGNPTQLKMLSGNSHDLFPKFSENAFDLVTVDGDHSDEGAMQDLVDAYRVLRPGGAILFDDIGHPLHPYLSKVWRTFAEKYAMDTAEYLSSGYGVAIGIKRFLIPNT